MVNERATEPLGGQTPTGRRPSGTDPARRQCAQSPADADGGPAPAGWGDGDAEHHGRLRVPVVIDSTDDLGAEAGVYLRAIPDPTQVDRPVPGVDEAHELATTFATTYGYSVIARYLDISELPLPPAGSAFERLISHLDEGLVRVVLTPSASWLAPFPAAQKRVAEMIRAHGGTLVIVDSAAALDIDPSDR